MISLQKFLFTPEVATCLDMSSTALYERQRALVRVGLLPQARSRGRKSGGALATPETVALIVLSILVTDSLSEVDERMATWAGLRAIEHHIRRGKGEILRVGKCRLTGQKTLHEALTKVIADFAGGIEIEVYRKQMVADLFEMSGNSIRSRFGHSDPGGGIQVKGTFSGLYSMGMLLETYSPRER
jgi:hypothetical protein